MPELESGKKEGLYLCSIGDVFFFMLKNLMSGRCEYLLGLSAGLSQAGSSSMLGKAKWGMWLR